MREAYPFRPRQFEVRSVESTGSSSDATIPSHISLDDDGFTIIGPNPKRKRAGTAQRGASRARGRGRSTGPVAARSGSDIRASFASKPIERNVNLTNDDVTAAEQTPSQWE